jgi:hypothetical protein
MNLCPGLLSSTMVPAQMPEWPVSDTITASLGKNSLISCRSVPVSWAPRPNCAEPPLPNAIPNVALNAVKPFLSGFRGRRRFDKLPQCYFGVSHEADDVGIIFLAPVLRYPTV